VAAYEVNAYGARAKVRNEGLVLLWTVITFGIYNIVWYYRINRELRDFGRIYQDEMLARENPAVSTVAITLGSVLVVPAIVSYYRTTGRIRRAQRIVSTPLTNGWVIFACYVGGIFIGLPALVIPPYVQSGLNAIWNRYPRIEEGEVPQPLGSPPADPFPRRRIPIESLGAPFRKE